MDNVELQSGVKKIWQDKTGVMYIEITQDNKITIAANWKGITLSPETWVKIGWEYLEYSDVKTDDEKLPILFRIKIAWSVLWGNI